VAPLITLLIERLFRVPMQVSFGTVSSLLVIILGVVVYHFHTLQLSWIGFASICLNMVFAVLERLLQRHLLAQDPVDLSKSAMMLLNNACGLLPNAALLVVYNEPPQWGEVFGQLKAMDYALIALSCLNGVAISYAGLRVQQLVTATTFMVMTNVNKFLVILFGAVFLGDRLTPAAGCGVLLATGGALWYAQVRRWLGESTAAKAAEPPAGETERAADPESGGSGPVDALKQT